MAVGIFDRENNWRIRGVLDVTTGLDRVGETGIFSKILGRPEPDVS